MTDAKNIIILSEKSSGSSACQNLLAKFADIRHVARTRHYQSETLYWTKAASVLERPQIDMVDSEVPLPPSEAKNDLLTLLRENIPGYEPPASDEDLIVQGWRQLCQAHGPIFLEKSPHHLCQWSAIELIVDCIEQVDDVDFLIIGLVRNPMDTIYSQFKRWRSPPRDVEAQWRTAYRNLQRLQEQLGDRVVILRYEDMVTSLKFLTPVFAFCGARTDAADEKYLHRRSLQKWRTDKLFGFTLADETLDLAAEFGYAGDELDNDPHPLWSIFQTLSRWIYLVGKPVTVKARNRLGRIRAGSSN